MENPSIVNPGWRKSSYSDNGGSTCVEVGALPRRAAAGAVLIRDTTDRGVGLVLRVSAETWRAFTTAIRASALG
jgi:hypothetical protein